MIYLCNLNWSRYSNLYYTDWGNQARVTRANLDGSDPVILASGLYNPNAVVYSAETGVVFVDSKYKLRERDGDEVKGQLYRSADETDGMLAWNVVQNVELEVRRNIKIYWISTQHPVKYWNCILLNIDMHYINKTWDAHLMVIQVQVIDHMTLT